MTKNEFEMFAADACKELADIAKIGFMDFVIDGADNRDAYDFGFMRACYEYGRGEGAKWLAKLDAEHAPPVDDHKYFRGD